ncbi:unnamed protein product, partial [marine sediment metagenome]
FVGEREVYEREHIYQKGLTISDLIRLLRDCIADKEDMIIADSADPGAIQEICNYGFNVFACNKFPGSVNHGIDIVRTMNIHILAGSENLQKEKRGYKWKQDAQGKQMNDPLKFRDHLMDAERYAICKVKRLIEAGITFAEDESEEAGEQIRYGKPEEPKEPVISEVTNEDILGDNMWE